MQAKLHKICPLALSPCAFPVDEVVPGRITSGQNAREPHHARKSILLAQCGPRGFWPDLTMPGKTSSTWLGRIERIPGRERKWPDCMQFRPHSSTGIISYNTTATCIDSTVFDQDHVRSHTLHTRVVGPRAKPTLGGRRGHLGKIAEMLAISCPHPLTRPGVANLTRRVTMPQCYKQDAFLARPPGPNVMGGELY